MTGLFSRLNAYRRNLARQMAMSAGTSGALRVAEMHLRARTGLRNGPVAIPMKKLDGRTLSVRPGTSDLLNASYYYADDLHLPDPAPEPDQVRQICELGSNMGACLSALAVHYPDARIVGVEPDSGNAAIARLNLAHFGDRCTIVQAGVWDKQTELIVDQTSSYGEHGFTVRERRPDEQDAGSLTALTIDAILDRHLPDGLIDYMHVTIEGSERRVFESGGRWIERVKCLRVEAHPEFGYPAEECIEQLEALGYEARRDGLHPDKWVHATKVLTGSD